MKPKKIIEKLECSIATIEELQASLDEEHFEMLDKDSKAYLKTLCKDDTKKAMAKAVFLIEDYKDLKKENKKLKERLEGKPVSSQSKKELTKEEKEKREKIDKLLEEAEKNKKAEPLPSVFGNVDIKGPFEGLEVEEEEIDEDMER